MKIAVACKGKMVTEHFEISKKSTPKRPHKSGNGAAPSGATL